MIELSFLIAAFFAGVLMFLAPCTLPLVPGYLAFVSGVSLGRTPDAVARRVVLRNALAFVVGFSIIFILLGTFAAFIGGVLGAWRFELARVAGVILIFFGLTMLGALRLPVISGEWHARIPRFLTLGRPESSFLIGALFAFGWSPCIGPILGSILLLASQSTTALFGALLLSVFSLGLALPFLLVALFFSHAQSFLGRWERAALMLQYVGGSVLVALGVLMLAGRMDLLIVWGYGLFDFLGYDRLLNYL